jgi:hypothetical protein
MESITSTVQSSILRDINYETDPLIWLDTSINCKENRDVQERLRLSINYLKTFDKLDECEKYIRSVPSEDRIILIVTVHFGQQLIPNIHSFQQVSSIYIYCGITEFDQEWIKQYRKVILVF